MKLSIEQIRALREGDLLQHKRTGTIAIFLKHKSKSVVLESLNKYLKANIQVEEVWEVSPGAKLQMVIKRGTIMKKWKLIDKLHPTYQSIKVLYGKA